MGLTIFDADSQLLFLASGLYECVTGGLRTLVPCENQVVSRVVNVQTQCTGVMMPHCHSGQNLHMVESLTRIELKGQCIAVVGSAVQGHNALSEDPSRIVKRSPLAANTPRLHSMVDENCRDTGLGKRYLNLAGIVLGGADVLVLTAVDAPRSNLCLRWCR